MTGAELRALRRKIRNIKPKTETEKRVQELTDQLTRECGGQLTAEQLNLASLTARAQVRITAIDKQLQELDKELGDAADKKVLQLMDRRQRLSDHAAENLRQLGLQRKNYLTAGGLDEDALVEKLLADHKASDVATGSLTDEPYRQQVHRELDALDLDPRQKLLLKRIIN